MGGCCSLSEPLAAQRVLLSAPHTVAPDRRPGEQAQPSCRVAFCPSVQTGPDSKTDFRVKCDKNDKPADLD